jgi:hypothetical protein
MLKRVLSAATLLCVTAIAGASDTPPAVETMDCDHMRTELVAAGGKMKSQLDPEFAKEAQAMMAEAQAGPSAGAVAQGVGMSVACTIPGVDMFCMAAQQAQAMAQGAQATQNMERMQAQMERLEKAMEGLDIERVEALSQRFEQQKCEVPQQQ